MKASGRIPLAQMVHVPLKGGGKRSNLFFWGEMELDLKLDLEASD